MKTSIKRILSFLVISLLLMTMISLTALSVLGDFAGGSGTAQNPFLVSTKEQLNNVRHYLSAHFLMTTDIVFNTADFETGGTFYNQGLGWLPIGTNASKPFVGVFDGGGHTIKGITLNITASGDVYAGLFGYNKGFIKKLGLIDGTVEASTTDTYASSNAGGIAGYNEGTISSCYNTGEVSVKSFSIYSNSGGIAGENSGTISNCYSAGTASVFSNSSYSGAGGITGYSAYNGTISNCYNIGMVFSASNEGGIAGHNYGTVSDCYYLNTVNLGIGNRAVSETISCTEQEMRSQITFTGFDFTSIWTIGGEYPYPVLRSVPHAVPEENTTEFGGGRGTSYSPYLISSKEHLNNVRNYLDAHFLMTANIIFTVADFEQGGDYYNQGLGWSPIGTNDANAFTGVFNGGGYTIQAIKSSYRGGSDIYVGLFRYSTGFIKNLGMTRGVVSVSHGTSSANYILGAGGIVGYNKGIISNCYNAGSVSSYFSGGEGSSNRFYAGGIAGYNEGAVNNCYNTGGISARSYGGGIVGYNIGVISDCYNNTSGGIAGYNNNKIANCYYLVSGTSETNIGTTSCTDQEMQSQETFVGFDFDTVWTIDPDSDYPYPVLKVFLSVNMEENTTEFGGGLGTEQSPYLISTKEHLNNVRNYLKAHFLMTVDIVFSDSLWTPIETFSGVFDGGNHTIKGLTVTAVSAVSAGLFGANSGLIKNLGMIDGAVSVNTYYGETSSQKLSIFVGSIAGSNSGTISNCYNTGMVSAKSAGYLSGASTFAGGIAGGNSGIISNCYNTGEISLTSTGYNSSHYSGGITGSGGTITDCYNVGAVSASSTASSSFSYSGGITGSGGAITNCYYLNTIATGVGNGADTGTTSCTEQEMQLQETFVGFDFDTVWTIDPDGDYPYPQLTSLMPPPEITSEIYEINSTANMVGGILPGVTAEQLLSGINENQYLIVLDGDTEINGSTRIGTGMLVQYIDSDRVKRTLTIVVTGDLNGDGISNAEDITDIKRNLLNLKQYNDVLKAAADLNKDDEISLVDLVEMKKRVVTV